MNYINNQSLGPDDNFDTENVEFVNCDFESITFESTNFKNIKISESRFNDCEFENCRFETAHFNQVNFTNTRISNSRFLDSTLENMILNANTRQNINVCRETNFFRCNLVNVAIKILLDTCVFQNNEYNGLDISRNIINNCSFSGENMASSDIDLTSSDFTSCHFDDTNLFGAQMGGTGIKGTSFFRCDFTGANLSHTNLQFTLFNECILNNVNLTYSDVYHVFIEDSEHDNMILDDVNIDDLTILDVEINDDDEQIDFLEEELPHQGVAFEIHNAFNRLDVKKLLDFIHSTSPPPISNFNLDHFIDSLKTFLTQQVSSLITENPEVYIEKLNAILDKMSCIDFNYEMPTIEMTRKEFLLHVISFAKNMNTDFYKNYLKIFIDDSYEAYGRGGSGISCPKGVMERIVLSLYFASVIFCPERFEECATPYKELIEIIGPAVGVHIDFGELQKEWFQNVASRVPFEERKQNYIDFMTRKIYAANVYNQANLDRINREADEMADADMFSDENVEMYQEGGKILLSKKYFM